MTAFIPTRFTARRAAAFALVLSGLIWTGCNKVEMRDSMDAKAPTGLPLPATTKVVVKKTVPVVPPPSEADLGIPVYPDAKTYVDETGTPILPQTTGAMKTAMLETPDSVDKVIDFYKSRITTTISSGSQPSTPREEQVEGKRKVVLTGNDTQGNIQMAQIREGSKKTVIELMHTQTKALPTGVPGPSAPDDIISGSLESSGSPSSHSPSSSTLPPSSDAAGAAGNSKTP